MPLIARGQSATLAAPTASGKTEAAIAPLYQRHISFKRERLSTLYIAPTKALANDIFERLEADLGIRSPGCVTRYTGNRHDFRDDKGRFCMIVTPEALDSLQLMRPAALAGVRAAVIDEIHLLHGAPRGQQLRFVLDRVRAGAVPPKDARDAFQFASQPGDSIATKSARALARWLRHSGPPKVLVFDNTRNGAHALAAALDFELGAAFGADGAPPLHCISVSSPPLSASGSNVG
jgi:ATP-dependent Lhr-like helicase